MKMVDLMMAKREDLLRQAATLDKIIKLMKNDGLSDLSAAVSLGVPSEVLAQLSAEAAQPKTRYKPGSRKMSPEARRKIAESMALRWADRKAKAAKKLKPARKAI